MFANIQLIIKSVIFIMVIKFRIITFIGFDSIIILIINFIIIIIRIDVIIT